MPPATSVACASNADTEASYQLTRSGDLIAAIERYYSGKVRQFGPTALGVDWSDEWTQQLRFVQLLRLVTRRTRFSINDFGCGYGALVGFLNQRWNRSAIDYLGLDISLDMVSQARKLWAKAAWAQFEVGAIPQRLADFTVASGVFNVRLNASNREWQQLVASTLRAIHEQSRFGFSVNFIDTKLISADLPLELYQADARLWARYCEQALRARTNILSGYGLKEFTLIAERRSSVTFI